VPKRLASCSIQGLELLDDFFAGLRFDTTGCLRLMVSVTEPFTTTVSAVIPPRARR
jgi:hypothetical protein